MGYVEDHFFQPQGLNIDWCLHLHTLPKLAAPGPHTWVSCFPAGSWNSTSMQGQKKEPKELIYHFRHDAGP